MKKKQREGFKEGVRLPVMSRGLLLIKRSFD